MIGNSNFDLVAFPPHRTVESMDLKEDLIRGIYAYSQSIGSVSARIPFLNTIAFTLL